ncbi:MAG: PrsW family intramembrane metalloprotease [Chloroflexia bacterium]|nr:PrsW family intramembrane metalloprotease [Chloroflexia bacterium]
MMLLLVAMVPTIMFVGLLWWLDRYEKEPWPLFLSAFAYGCIPAIILSIIFELVLDIPLGGSAYGDIIGVAIVAPVVEEAVKGLAVLLIFFIWRREFDGVLDGIMYGAVVGFGFAMTENFFYFLDTAGDPIVIVMRSLVFGANHAFFTGFSGAALGLARQSKKRSLWLLLFPAGLLLAMLFHAAHNFFVSALQCPGLLLALFSNGLGVIVVVVVAFLAAKQERKWIEQELAEEVTAATIAEADFQTLLSARRRAGARLWAWRNHGWRAFRLLGKYLNLATELAFGKHFLREGTAHRKRSQDVQKVRKDLADVRAQLLRIMEKA